MRKVLVTGALGQIGSELTLELCNRYGSSNIIATDIREPDAQNSSADCTFAKANVLVPSSISELIKKYKIDTIYHLAALLSAVAESDPQKAWKININGLYNILEIARECECSVFTPSSIGAFGPTTPAVRTPQDTIQQPTTMYGVTKVSGELLCDYYHKRFSVDTRGVRYPGIISYKTLPGGGTTDYAVEIYYEALKQKKYTCFLQQDTYLDMMYMPDAVKAAIDLMEADPQHLKHRNAFNVTAMSLDPNDIAESIREHIPEFKIEYDVDPVRQAIADSWPDSLDDSAARTEWGWKPSYNLKSMTADMIEKLSIKLNINK